MEKTKNWDNPKGQLVVDVYETDTEIVVQSAIAGVKNNDIDISIENDILIIKGERQKSGFGHVHGPCKLWHAKWLEAKSDSSKQQTQSQKDLPAKGAPAA